MRQAGGQGPDDGGSVIAVWILFRRQRGNLDVFKVINDVVIFVFYKITRVAAKRVSREVQKWKQQEQLEKLLVAVIQAARMGRRGPVPGGTYGSDI